MYMLVCMLVCIASALVYVDACMLGVYAGVGRGVFCWGAFFSSYFEMSRDDSLSVHTGVEDNSFQVVPTFGW